ncbi:MAG: hypothetical protein QHJ81_15005, partial [Anaerolineae bacterium]|nr:hypothetical protein [Anaerolineae bacterium]
REALRTEMERRFTQAKEEREALRTEMERRFTQAKEEREALRTEMRAEIQTLRAEMHAQFRWTIGLLFPLVAGMLAIIVRVFLMGTP